VPLQEACCGSAAGSLFCLAADFGVGGFEDAVNKIETLVIGEEGAFHGVYGDSFKVVEGEIEGVGCGLEFPGHGGVAHKAVVGV